MKPIDRFSLRATLRRGRIVLNALTCRAVALTCAVQKTTEIKLPAAITVFPDDDLFRVPETWARRAFPSLIYFRQAERGGHLAAWEHAELFAAERRAAFKSLH